MTDISTDAFSRVLSPYLHQDWYDEFQDSSQAIAAAVELEPRELFVDVRREIDDIILSEKSDEELEIIIRNQAGCYFSPHSEGYTYRSWLIQIREALPC